MEVGSDPARSLNASSLQHNIYSSVCLFPYLQVQLSGKRQHQETQDITQTPQNKTEKTLKK